MAVPELSSCVSCGLPYTPPYDWENVLSFFRAHQVPHLEAVDDLGYERVVSMRDGLGWFRVTEDKARHSLRLSVWKGGEEDVTVIASAARRMFDLDADPQVLRGAMSADGYLASVWTRHPGLRVSRAWSAFETMLGTILGQLVSVGFGRTLVNEMMTAAGSQARHPKTGEPMHLFPTAQQLLEADLSTVRTSEARRSAIRGLAKLVAEGRLNWQEAIAPRELRKALLSVRGVGQWTAEYIAMRGFHDNDAFPATDYALKQELRRHPEVQVNRVRPWRAYAAIALWKSFAENKDAPDESVV